jgi:hypothetical protein
MRPSASRRHLHRDRDGWLCVAVLRRAPLLGTEADPGGHLLKPDDGHADANGRRRARECGAAVVAVERGAPNAVTRGTRRRAKDRWRRRHAESPGVAVSIEVMLGMPVPLRAVRSSHARAYIRVAVRAVRHARGSTQSGASRNRDHAHLCRHGDRGRGRDNRRDDHRRHGHLHGIRGCPNAGQDDGGSPRLSTTAGRNRPSGATSFVMCCSTTCLSHSPQTLAVKSFMRACRHAASS